MKNPNKNFGSVFLRQLLRWTPAVILFLILALCWSAVWRGGLAGALAWDLLISLVPLLGAAALIFAAIYAVWKRRFSLPIAIAIALALIAIYPFGWNFGLLPIKYPSSLEKTTPSATVRLPGDVSLRVGWGGDDLEVNYHAAYPDQRWAYDLVVDPSFSGSERLEDYGCWGVPVVAPASGKIVKAHDAEPDETPGSVSNNFENPKGNFVAVELPTKTYLIIAHLQRGSVAVKADDEVQEGQMLGRCGNSGNTSEPHIHIHHQRQHPDFLDGFLAEGLPLYFRNHDGEPMPQGGFKIADGRAVPKGAIVRHLGNQ